MRERVSGEWYQTSKNWAVCLANQCLNTVGSKQNLPSAWAPLAEGGGGLGVAYVMFRCAAVTYVRTPVEIEVLLQS
jgi:hypothetical protein